MANPIIVQVNIFNPFDDYCSKLNEGVTMRESENACNYISSYLDNFSEAEIQEQTGLTRKQYEEELFSDMPMVTDVYQFAFKDALEQWAALHGTTIGKMVRGYVSCNRDRFQMVHGIGYDWMSADLFGGDADGKARKDFDVWAEEELGIRFFFE